MVNDGVQCPMINTSLISGHLKKYLKKEVWAFNNHNCGICAKNFKSEEYLEFHMKAEHFKEFKMQQSYNKFGTICPAELCDVFECPDLSDKKLKVQTYNWRSHNHEG